MAIRGRCALSLTRTPSNRSNSNTRRGLIHGLSISPDKFSLAPGKKRFIKKPREEKRFSSSFSRSTRSMLWSRHFATHRNTFTFTFTVGRRARSFVVDSVKASTARLMIIRGESKRETPFKAQTGTDRHKAQKGTAKNKVWDRSRWILWRDGCDDNGSLDDLCCSFGGVRIHGWWVLSKVLLMLRLILMDPTCAVAVYDDD